MYYNLLLKTVFAWESEIQIVFIFFKFKIDFIVFYL